MRQNFHRVLLGTFHAKFLVVDRKVALLNSNNIQGVSISPDMCLDESRLINSQIGPTWN